jgi:hypothetical protein
MKKKQSRFDINAFMKGYDKGKKEIVEKLLKFVDNESEFLPDVHIDALLDRLVKFIKKI